MRRGLGVRFGRRGVVAGRGIGLVLAAALVWPVAARAEEQPAIVRAYGLDWIERVQESAWPQPPEQRPVICLLDTGVNVTPDTPADSPTGPIVARLALDGGSGVAQGDTPRHRHGTDMAAVIAAPRNGVGTVGVFPQARILSIRVSVGDAVYITPGAVRVGFEKCVTWAASHPGGVAALVLAESNYDTRPSDLLAWQDLTGFAEALGIPIVAAAGNDASSQIAPLGLPTVVSVTAGDVDGQACEFVSGLPQTGGLRGPGCADAWPSGSSAATGAVGALVAALRTRDPAITPGSMRQQLAAASDAVDGGQRRLRAGSLSAPFVGHLDPPRALSTAQATGLNVTVEQAAVVPARFWRPKISASWAGRKLEVRRRDHRGGNVLAVQIRDGGAVVRVAGRRLTLVLRHRPARIRVWVESGPDPTWQSLTSRVRVQ